MSKKITEVSLAESLAPAENPTFYVEKAGTFRRVTLAQMEGCLNDGITAAPFSAATAYAAGDYVVYNGKLYCFTADHAAGAWTGSDASVCRLADEMSLVKSHLDAMSTASASDEGKALIAKTVTNGTVTEWEFGEAGGGGSPEIVCNASGAVASFPDGANNVPVESLTVSMEPIQDLHGQANPYPGGGGKNLLPMNIDTIKSLNTSGAWNDNAYSLNGVVFTVLMDEAENITGVRANGTATENAIFNVGRWTGIGEKVTITGCPSGGSTSTYRMFWDNGGSETGQGIQPTPAEGVTVTGRVYIYGGYTANNLLFKPMICLATATDPTVFAPYSNICPISGRQGVTVWGSGANLFDGEVVNGRYTNGEFVVTNSYRCSKNFMPCYPGMQIHFRDNNNALFGSHVTLFTASGSFISTTQVSSGHFTIPTDSNARWFKFHVPSTYYTTITALCVSTTDTAYEPYNGQQIEVPLGQTVYGGTVDVTTGEMVVKSVKFTTTADTLRNFYNGTYATGAGYILDANFPAKMLTSAEFPNASSSIFSSAHGTLLSGYAAVGGSVAGLQTRCNNSSFAKYGWTMSDKYLAIYDPDTTISEADFKAKYNEAEFVYELATPLTVQLVGQSLSTLKGVNNIWSDGGNVSVDYVADTKLYIAQLTEPDADMIADANITSGKYFMVGNSLYLATANIASGASIVPGVNCTRTSLASALNAINS